MNTPTPTPGVDIRPLGQSAGVFPGPQPDDWGRRGSAGNGNGNGNGAGTSTGTADISPRRCTLRTQFRLTTWIAWPTSGPARRDALRITWSAAIVALPCAVWLAAPAGSVGLGALFALACAAVPGSIATALAAAREREPRATTSKALRQAGADQLTARLIAAARTAACAALGALLGAAAVPAASPLLNGALPHHSPLRAMLAASPTDWIEAVAATVILATAGALAVGAPFWSRIDWQAITWRRPKTLLTALTALKARPPLR